MIEPGRSGHRNRAVARDAARQVSTKKNGFRLTWILTTTKGREPALRMPSKRSGAPPDTAVTGAVEGKRLGILLASLKDGEDRTPALLPRDRIPAY